jgi:GT2 family glycosyltransferase
MAPAPASISVAILSYNRCDELRRTLGILARTPELWHEVIVADNASADGTPAMVRAEFPTARLIETGGNTGIAGSNLAYSAATGAWVLSLDDDSAPVAETFAPLSRELAAGCPAAAIALSVRRGWGPPRAPTAGALLAPSYGFSSAGVLFNRRALTEVGTYDPELFLFTNELHWTARALLAGWPILKADSACVVHRSAPANRSSARHAYHYTRNLLLFLLRYAPAPLARPLAARYFQRAAAYTVLHRTGIYLRAMRDAFALLRRNPTARRPLRPEQLALINPDWRAGFAYLG